MSRTTVWYLAAPVSGDVAANLARAARWLRWLRDREPDVVIIAPWLGPLLAGTERDDVPEDRARGLRDCVEVVKRCDGIVLVGGRVTKGMQLELDAMCAHGQGGVADLTSLGEEPPADYDEQYPPEFDGDLVSPIEVGCVAWEAK